MKNDAVYLKDRVLFLASDWVICLSLGFVAVCVGSNWWLVINAGVRTFVMNLQINRIWAAAGRCTSSPVAQN